MQARPRGLCGKEKSKQREYMDIGAEQALLQTTIDINRISSDHIIGQERILPALSRTVRITEIAGKFLFLGGGIGTSWFFAAPVILPVSVTLAISTVLSSTQHQRDFNTPQSACHARIRRLCLSLIVGIPCGVFVGLYSWNSLVKIVSDPQVVKLGYAIGGTITGVGALLVIASTIVKKSRDLREGQILEQG